MSWRLDPKKTAFAVIDIQEKLIPVIAGKDRVVAKAVQMARIAKLFGIPVFVTEQTPDKLGPTVPDVLAAIPSPSPLAKTTFSAAPILPLDMPKCILVAGIETHVCVRQTVYDLRVRDHVVYVLADAVGSRATADHDIALAELRSDKVLITSVEAVAWEMLDSSDSKLFRPGLAILK
ncbi:MAG TPA: isochorismatase family protein [Verrucomicrobiae bacterium]|nr:isochorismatase family protein [Verrucomicrobiae bacterium]